jgi:hypothetical protein
MRCSTLQEIERGFAVAHNMNMDMGLGVPQRLDGQGSGSSVIFDQQDLERSFNRGFSQQADAA